MNTNETTSKETQFLGVRTVIEDMELPVVNEQESEPELEVEVVQEAEQEAEQKAAEQQEPPVKQTFKTESTEEGATDDDLEDYSEKVRKRIGKITYERREAERQAKDAKDRYEEAMRITQELWNQNQQYQSTLAAGEERLISEISARAEAALNAARLQYKKAYDEGTADDIIEAQEALLQAKYHHEAAIASKQEYQQRVQQWQQAQQAQRATTYQQQHPSRIPVQQPKQPQAPPPPAVSEETRKWAEKNPWFGDDNYRDMTAVAFAEHQTLVTDFGVEPDSDEYYQRIDAKMRKTFPQYKWEKAADDKPGKKTSPAVVAPVESNRGGRPRKVSLTPTQVAIAHRLGVSPEQYAAQLINQED